MATLRLEWEHVGPAREQSIEVPGISIGNYAYALVYDPTRDRIVYHRVKDYGGPTEVWIWDGARWELTKTKGLEIGDENHAFFDASRGGVATWSIEHDHERKRHVPMGVITTASAAREIETTGEPPLVEPDSKETFFRSSNMCCAMAYDADRDVTACLTRRGVYELDANGSWTRAGDPTGVPAEWHNDTGGAYDPVGKRCVFWLQRRGDGYKYELFAWAGGRMSKLSTKGLPDLMSRSSDPVALFCAHPEHGIVCSIGPRGRFALDGDAWKKLPDAANPPPILGGRFANHRPRMAYHPKLDAFVIGPGHLEGREGGGEPQQVFWVLRGKTWERQGSTRVVSPIEKLRSRHHAVVDSTWYATTQRGLHAMKWTEGGWSELVDDKTGDAVLGREMTGGIAATPDGLVSISTKGAVFRLDDKGWKQVSKPSAAFKERSEFLVAWDGARLVAWGGEVKNRKANDTLMWDGKDWTAVKQSSPLPIYKTKQVEFIDFTIVHDTTLDRLVRFGFADVATLEGDVWKSTKPKRYSVGARRWEHIPAHDPQTGETLLIDLEKRSILRFDLAGCAEVGTFEYPSELVEETQRERSSITHYFATDCVFHPGTRSLQMQHAGDSLARMQLDLSRAFDAGKQLGARKTLGAIAKPRVGPITLYKHAKGKVEAWRGDAKQLDAKRKTGFVPALELPVAALEALGTLASAELKVGSKKPASRATSRLGGLPSGVTEKTWPKLRTKPMGFLFQLVTDAVPGYAGVAVFCALDGSATEDGDQNAVIPLRAVDLAKAPLAKPPAGVIVLKERAIAIAKPLPEIDEAAVEPLIAKDPDLGAAFDAYQSKSKVQDSNLASKLGGAPMWLQSSELGKAQFVAQLDVDNLGLDEWEDAGLMGCIYILAQGKRVFALWQYT